jgi:hypothetical protein
MITGAVSSPCREVKLLRAQQGTVKNKWQFSFIEHLNAFLSVWKLVLDKNSPCYKPDLCC